MLRLEQTRSNRVCYFLFFGVLLALKGSNFPEVTGLARRIIERPCLAAKPKSLDLRTAAQSIVKFTY